MTFQCARCNGSGIEDYRVHGIDHTGACIETIKCRECDGFGHVESQPMTAQTPAQRQADLRARRAIEGLTEVRGIFLPSDKHAELKAHAAKMRKAINRAKPKT